MQAWQDRSSQMREFHCDMGPAAGFMPDHDARAGD
jgi:hypothetical protein